MKVKFLIKTIIIVLTIVIIFYPRSATVEAVPKSGIYVEQSILVEGGRFHRIYDTKTKTYCFLYVRAQLLTSMSCKSN